MTAAGCGDQILVHADSPIRSVADLRGKSIAVAKGSSAHGHTLGSARERAGLTPADVKLVFLQPADALSAFTQREVDAWAVWDPYTAQAEQQIPVRSIARAKGVTNGCWFGIASDVALADPKRNTALGDLLVRYERPPGGPTTTPSSGPKGTPRSRSRSRSRPARAGPKPAAAHRTGRSTSWHPNRSWPTCSPHSKQIPAAPKFSDWVDRRYNDALRPLLINTN